MEGIHLNGEFHYQFGGPICAAGFKQTSEDFIVDEWLEVEPDGAGEHLLLHLRKRNMNTQYVARHVARVCGVRERDVSFCGMKDRVAVASQWFSVHLPGTDFENYQALSCEGLTLISSARHGRKLRRGAHSGNRFRIVLRALSADPAMMEERLSQLRDQGFPNYFGEQRFSRADNEALNNQERAAER